MKTLCKLVCCLSLLSGILAFGQGTNQQKQCPQQFDKTVSVSATTITIPNDCGAVRFTVEEIVTGGPASMSAVFSGCMRGGSACTALDTNTSTTSVTRKPVIDTVYDYFTLTATWTGGTSPTFTVHTTSSIASLGGNSLTGSAPIVISAGVVSCPACGTSSGNVTGAVSSTLNHVAIFDSTTGKSIADSGVPMPGALACPANQLVNQYTGSTGVFNCRALATGDIPNNAANTSGTAGNLSGTPTLPSGTVLPGYTPNTIMVNGHPLSSNVVVSASDVTTGTLPHAQLPALVSGDIPSNAANTSGNAGTATQLAATPTPCTGSNLAGGIDAHGNSINCAPSGAFTYPPSGIMTSTGSGAGTSLTPPSSAIVGISDTQTITNKDFTDISNHFSGMAGRQFTSGTTDTITTTDVGHIVHYAAGASNVTSTLIDVATSPTPYPTIPVRNTGTGTITVNRTSVSTINGGTSVTVYPQSSCTFNTVDTVNWLAVCASLLDASGNLNANTTGTAANLSGTPTLPSGVVVPGYTPTSRTVNSHPLSGNVTVTQTDVGLGSVTNDVQTKAAIVPNTTPLNGQVLVGNGVNYAPQTTNGDGTFSVAGLLNIVATHLSSPLPGAQGGLGVTLASLGDGTMYDVGGTTVKVSSPIWDAHAFGTGIDGAAKINSIYSDTTKCPTTGCIIDARNFQTASGENILGSNIFHGRNVPAVILINKPMISCVPQIGGQAGVMWMGTKSSATVDVGASIRAGTAAECGLDFPGGVSTIVLPWKHGQMAAGTYSSVLNECGAPTTDNPVGTADCFADVVANLQINANGLANFGYYSCCVEERGGLWNVGIKGVLDRGMFFDRGFQIGPGSPGGSGPTHFSVIDTTVTPDSGTDARVIAVEVNGNTTYLEFTGQSGCNPTSVPAASGQPTAYSIMSGGIPQAPVLTNKGDCSTPPTACTLHSPQSTIANVCTLTTGGSGAHQNVATVTFTTAGTGYPSAQVPTGGFRLERATLNGSGSGNRLLSALVQTGTYDSSAHDIHTERVACDAVQWGEGSAPTRGGLISNVDVTNGIADATLCPNGATVHIGLGQQSPGYTVTAVTRFLSNGKVIWDDNIGTAGFGVANTDSTPHDTIPLYSNGSLFGGDLTLQPQTTSTPALNILPVSGSTADMADFGTTAKVTSTGVVSAFKLQSTTILDANGNPFLLSTATASAVDGLTVGNAATANPATVPLSATGTDTNINLNLVSKGTGVIQCNGVPCPVSGLYTGTDTGTSGTNYVIANVVPTVSAYALPMLVCFTPTHANSSGTPTLVLGALAAKTIAKPTGALAAANEILTTKVACAEYDATADNFKLLTAGAVTGTGTAVQATAPTFITGITTPKVALSGGALIDSGAPTISSGFGTTPSIQDNNGTASFVINVGTGGTATSGIIGFPVTAAHRWVVHCDDITTQSTSVFITKQTGGASTSAATITQYNISGVATAWVASDLLACTAFAE